MTPVLLPVVTRSTAQPAGPWRPLRPGRWVYEKGAGRAATGAWKQQYGYTAGPVYRLVPGPRRGTAPASLRFRARTSGKPHPCRQVPRHRRLDLHPLRCQAVFTIAGTRSSSPYRPAGPTSYKSLRARSLCQRPAETPASSQIHAPFMREEIIHHVPGAVYLLTRHREDVCPLDDVCEVATA